MMILRPLMIVLVVASGCGSGVATDLVAGSSVQPATVDSDVAAVLERGSFLDSDGDGFSDDDEVNFIPGTDPFDPTDNPENVRDTDGDGCSDFDELTLFGMCDNDPDTRKPDQDNDDVPDDVDNCLFVANPDQVDTDADGNGDSCDVCEGGDDGLDTDGDLTPDDCDNCPLVSNFFQFDFDGDSVGDSCDNCVFDGNPSQIDSDSDGVGDACTLVFDWDGDGVENAADNCLFDPNPDQVDSDGNGIGDACEIVFDVDGDGIPDGSDNCIIISNPDQTDTDGDGIGDACGLVVPGNPPTGTRSISKTYPSLIVLDDNTVWDTLGPTSWQVGDAVGITPIGLENFDRGETTLARELGTLVRDETIVDIILSDEFINIADAIRLGDGSLWGIPDSIDAGKASQWPRGRVLVVSNLLRYSMIRTTNNDSIQVVPL